MSIRTCLPLALAGFLTAAGAQAEDGRWQFSASFYMFMAETETAIDTATSSLDSTLTFSDALENLDFAFMGAFEAHNGQWGGLIDVLHYDLSFGTDTSGPAFSGVDTDLELNVVTIAGLYRVFEDDKTALDLTAGLRWTEVDTTLTLNPGVARGRSVSDSVDWVDAIVGARLNHQFSDRWSGTANVDWGGFDSDSETWQVLLLVNYALNDSWSLRGGYRHISFENENDGTTLNIDQSGPLFGVTYQF
ncbi:MAG: DUF481 domain-containing protein [Pseudomonadota bacterium]